MTFHERRVKSLRESGVQHQHTPLGNSDTAESVSNSLVFSFLLFTAPGGERHSSFSQPPTPLFCVCWGHLGDAARGAATHAESMRAPLVGVLRISRYKTTLHHHWERILLTFYYFFLLYNWNNILIFYIKVLLFLFFKFDLF